MTILYSNYHQMNRLFLILFGMATYAVHAQVPDYVPTDGLIAWYPFNGNANDESGNAYHGEVNGAMLTTDRFLEPNSAYSFSGNCQDRIDMLVPEMTENTSFTVSFWAKRNGTGCYNPRMWEFYGGSRTTQCGWFNDWDSITFSGFPIVGANLENENWYHFALTNNGVTWEAYFNGEFNNFILDSSVINSPDLAIGRMNHPAWDSFNGEIDDFAIWDRALSAEDILALFNAQLPIPGCTDSTACNYNEEATDDDDSCVYPLFGDDCETGGAACGEGTVWDSDNQSCVAWNDCPSDLDGDGVIGVSDLMSLLADFGTDCQPVWACGIPVNYNGYDYSTVLIGEQCWLAENLRTEQYQNGDTIPGELSDDAWGTATYGGVSHYGADGLVSFGSDDPILNAQLYGLLYNGFATQDERGLCPTGWSIPSDEQWMELEYHLGMDSIEVFGGAYRGDKAPMIKNNSTDIPAWNGVNSTGWSGAPGGARAQHEGFYFEESLVGYYWGFDADWSGGSIPYRALGGGDGIFRANRHPTAGFSVRCVAN